MSSFNAANDLRTAENGGANYVCMISGQSTAQPMLNPKNGRVYDATLIRTHLMSSSTDPIDNSELNYDQLVAIQLKLPLRSLSASIRTPSLTSFSTIMNSLQQEYNTIVLDCHQLHATNNTLRTELAHSLYQYDAATRVIARLIKERDEAIKALHEFSLRRPASSSNQSNLNGTDTDMVDSEKSETYKKERVQNIVEKTADVVGQSNRKAYVKSQTAQMVPASNVKLFEMSSSHPMHSVVPAGVLSVDAVAFDSSVYTATAGVDGTVIIFDAGAGIIHETIKVPAKSPANTVKFIHQSRAEGSLSSDFPPLPLSILFGCKDSSIYQHEINLASRSHHLSHKYTHHSDSVTDISIHPSSLLAVSASLDSHWSLFDLTTKTPVIYQNTSNQLHTINIHPDGRILATDGVLNAITVFDIISGTLITTLRGHNASISSIAFSQNGYISVSGDANGCLNVWDLRKVNSDKPVLLQSINVTNGSALTSITMDKSGSLMCVGSSGGEMYLYDCKSWSCLKTWESAHSSEICEIVLGDHNSWIGSVGMDRQLKFWKTPIEG